MCTKNYVCYLGAVYLGNNYTKRTNSICSLVRLLCFVSLRVSSGGSSRQDQLSDALSADVAA